VRGYVRPAYDADEVPARIDDQQTSYGFFAELLDNFFERGLA